MGKSETNEQVERLEQLLDVGLAALKKGDDLAAILALQEALKAAESLPRAIEIVLYSLVQLLDKPPKFLHVSINLRHLSLLVLAAEIEMARVGILMHDEIEKRFIERAQSNLDPNFHLRNGYTSPSGS